MICSNSFPGFEVIITRAILKHLEVYLNLKHEFNRYASMMVPLQKSYLRTAGDILSIQVIFCIYV